MNRLKITVLVENCAGGRDLLAEHGLSFLIESGRNKILFDTGQGLALRHNTEKLSINLKTIDVVVLSHGHYDHTGGLTFALNGMSCIFGPVPSRRLGRSLGIDLVPFKTCSYDCIYCQLGRTTSKTIERKEWVPLETVLDDLKPKLALKPDWITLSGSGEPTLYSRIDELINEIHAVTDVPVAVLTNGSLLWQPDVRKQLMKAELVIPSLDAGNKAVFDAINRPAPDITFKKMLKGLIHFRQDFKNQYWLELFFLKGINTADHPVRDIADCTRQIQPDRVQLNTATRPPAEKYAVQVSQARLIGIAAQFNPPAEIIADYPGVHAQINFVIQKHTILEMLSRRPCTLDDVAGGLGIHRNEAIKYIEELKTGGAMDAREAGGQTFYSAKQKGNPQRTGTVLCLTKRRNNHENSDSNCRRKTVYALRALRRVCRADC